ncbi:hypothetical protein [Fodinicola acaciae]|uniref:hypothetical protein n=1 Tax=Fodinicola acaciae TaxID=2681555 RepID=UPI0013D1144A|nr:hypothetical protein [Fodinicola acaciae]
MTTNIPETASTHDTIIGFYAGLRSGARTALLAGPYETYDEAAAVLDQAITAAEAINSYAPMYDRGVVRVQPRPGHSLPAGKLNDRLS